MREWPDEIIDTFQNADVDYDTVAELEGLELFKAYMAACGLDQWTEHLMSVLDWCHDKPAAGDEMPEHLGQVADEFKRVSQIRIAMGKEVDAIKARETELREHLINNIDSDNEKGVMGMHYQATIKTDTKPRIDPEKWSAFHDWIADNDRFDLLQKRLSDKAVMELINEGAELPGIEKMHVKSVSIRKI